MKKSIVILSFIISMVQLGAQTIPIVTEVKLFEHIGDTLYFNRAGYPWIQHHSKDSLNNNITHVYYLATSSELDNNFSIQNHRYKVFEKFINHSKSEDKELYHLFSWESLKTRYPTIKLNDRNLDYFLRESQLSPPKIKKEETKKWINIDIDVLPQFYPAVDSLLNSLYFYQDPAFNGYAVTISIDDSVKVGIKNTASCTPTDIANKSKYTVGELEVKMVEWITQLNPPVLKIDKKAYPYKTRFNLTNREYHYYVLKTEVKTGFKKSKKVFTDNDTLLKLHNPLIEASYYYSPYCFNLTLPPVLPEDYSKRSYVREHDQPPYTILPDEKVLKRIDINHDNREDILVDTIISYSDNTISYIPNINALYNYRWSIRDKITYHIALGNHFYYMYFSDYNLKIFYIKDDNIHNVLSIATYSDDPYEYRFSHKILSCYVYNIEELTKKIQISKKESHVLQEKVLNLIRSYLEHPEKLPIDFPMN
jgi:hypothetical protein